jgi:6-phosphogluconolactonase
MGADMHTASIFPNSPDLSEALSTTAPLVAVQPPDGLEPRLSLSMSALKGAMSCHIVIVGPDKRAALDKALHLPPEQAPIAALLTNAIVHWTES